MKPKIGVLGLGNMGAGMASTLVKKGYDVKGFDLSTIACEKAVAAGVSIADSAPDLFACVDLLILSLPKAEHVEAVCLNSDGILQHGKKGLIVLDTTTSTPETSRKIQAMLTENQISFVDAPVSGGPAGASSGTMTMVVGASDALWEILLPVLQDMSATQVHVGDCGAGNVVKIANNFLAAAHLITTAEAVSMAAKMGVTPQSLLDGINAGSGRSAVSQVSFPKWVLNKTYNSGFTMGLMRKDVGLATAMTAGLELDYPMLELVQHLWKNSVETLPDAEDFNAIVMRTDGQLFAKGDL